MEYGCIGERLGHSFSKEIHARLFDYDYQLLELTPEQLPKFMTERSFKAVNVTIPYKQAVIPYLEYIDPKAREIGAVNTVVNRNGSLYGYNTDFSGLTALLKKSNIAPRGKKVLIAGSGGTSKTAAAVVAALGARECYRLSRSSGEETISYSEAYSAHSDADIIINTTPCGMFPNICGSALDISRFPKLCGVADAVYNPLRSQLVSDALERNIPAAGGLYMLVAQAVAAAELFTGESLPADTADRVWKEIAEEKENIVLIGMPGCGKSTVGKALAGKRGASFIDTDAEITSKTGKTPSELITKLGEEEFRKIESRVICELSAVQGAVIATGGGAVLKKENIFRLKQNGKLIFLDRPLEQLAVTSSRPLSSNTELLKKRYDERYSIFLSAGKRVDASGSVEETVLRTERAAKK